MDGHVLFMSAGFGCCSSGGSGSLSGMSDPTEDPKAAPAGPGHESRKSPEVVRLELLLAAHRAEFLDECRMHGDDAAARACLADFEREALGSYSAYALVAEADTRKSRWGRRAAWRLALLCWRLRLDALGNHFEDVAFCGKRWLDSRSATGVDSP